MRILVAESDPALGTFLQRSFGMEKYEVDLTAEGDEAERMARAREYAAVILDMNLLRPDGLEVLRHLRSERPHLRILLLSNRVRPEERAEHRVKRAGRTVELTPKEFALLEYLMRNAGRRVTRAQIIEHVWSLSFNTMTNVVDVYINYLRKKVDAASEQKLIHTIRGIGYELRA